MESSETCLSRAAADREAAEQSALPNERLRFEHSAERWESMAKMAKQVETERANDLQRKAEAKAAAEEVAILAEIAVPPATRSLRERLFFLRSV